MFVYGQANGLAQLLLIQSAVHGWVACFFISFTVFCFHTSVHAEPVSVTEQAVTADGVLPVIFGQRLGESLSLPACSDSAAFRISKEAPDVCIDPNRWSPLRPHFKIGSKPEWVFELEFELINGKVERITIFTKGVEFQASALADVIEKFGRPMKREVVEVQNAYSAKYQSIQAYWNAPGYSVVFSGLGRQISSGFVEIRSDKAKRSLADEVGVTKPKL